MATDVVFPLYDILVNNIFGSIALAIIGVGILLALILFITRTSALFLVYWVFLFYGMVMFTFYFGVLGLVLTFIIGVGIITYNLIKLQLREG